MKNLIVLQATAFVVTLALSPDSARAGDPVPVCVGPDRSLRLEEPIGSCAPGDDKRVLTEWEGEIEEQVEAGEEEKAILEKRIEALSNRLAALERARSEQLSPEAGKALRVAAPFEVVSGDGTVILRVAEKVPSQSGGGARVTIGAGDAGNFGVRIFDSRGHLVAGVGQSTSGNGIVSLMDPLLPGTESAKMRAEGSVYVMSNGQVVASMGQEEGGRGLIGVFGRDGGNGVAYMTESSHGKGGNFTAAMSNGEGVFSAGAASDGLGEACVNRVTSAGTSRTACLGVGLPGMGSGQ